MNKFEKQCPSCNCTMSYTNKDNRNSAIKNNRMCYSCAFKYKRKIIYTDAMRKSCSDRVTGEKIQCMVELKN